MLQAMKDRFLAASAWGLRVVPNVCPDVRCLLRMVAGLSTYAVQLLLDGDVLYNREPYIFLLKSMHYMQLRSLRCGNSI